MSDFDHGRNGGMHPIFGNREEFVAGQLAGDRDRLTAMMTQNFVDSMQSFSKPPPLYSSNQGDSSPDIDPEVLLAGAGLMAGLYLVGMLIMKIAALVASAGAYLSEENRQAELARDRQASVRPIELRQLAERYATREMHDGYAQFDVNAGLVYLYDGEAVVRGRPVQIVAQVTKAAFLDRSGCPLARISLEFIDVRPSRGIFQSRIVPVCSSFFRNEALQARRDSLAA